MNTPITDKARYRDAYNSPTEDVPASVAIRLELDRAALMEALGGMLDLSYKIGVNNTDYAIEQAEHALDAARANFPEQH